ncbi:hypothetical protein HDU77_005314 [Chytriomyces hyalinus]|uniref:Dolichyl-diphosphooligosaccharide--protein glycosyltransferase subunit 4 n=1 Tax=Chytriomyces confervae TaxID=246404 RepID=A0A507FGI7_9FUNG|nr:hypothetical protein BJ741DRAFT_615606 [Chytriomyces cf. hyalinus JEL632]KAJ3267112.1 hypothetical protein HDU77_005314 [Chytriomyces hyalinus]KAJ3405086.1 hypothetical protein HDU80_001920 [Chytriomyces hyalinus]TPX75364.1 hypothetical protein CcCBS67573_g03354 [Chytriomyces confervae]
MSERKHALANPVMLAGFFGLAVLSFVFGPGGQAIRKKFNNAGRDSRIITDDQLAIIVNFLGSVTFILIIVHHYLEVGRKKVVTKW